MSKPDAYSPGMPLTIIPRGDWRRRPELFLGQDPESWWSVLVEHFLAAVGDPVRVWRRASLKIRDHSVQWTDEAELPPERPDLFWRDACLNLSRDRGVGLAYTTSFSIDPLLPAPVAADPRTFGLVLRCAARAAGRSVDVVLDDRQVVSISGSWLAYAALGAEVRWHRRVDAGPFEVDIVQSDAPEAGFVEVLERGVAVGRWLGLERIVRELAPGKRIILHTEVQLPSPEREALAMRALELGIAK